MHSFQESVKMYDSFVFICTNFAGMSHPRNGKKLI